MSRRLLIALTISLVTVLGLSGCGVKGPLEPPPSAVQSEGSAPSGAGTPGTAPKEEKHRPFILDGLL